MTLASRALEDYRRIERAIRFIESHAPRQPALADIARAVHLSPSHLQHLFRRWAGVGPKRFLEALTLGHAKVLLARGESVLGASLGAGLSGPGRLHDLFVVLDATTPGEFKRRGEGMRIACGIHPTPFGEVLVGVTERGVCHLSFVTHGQRASTATLQRHWPKARLHEDHSATQSVAAHLFARTRLTDAKPLSLLVRGTNFQINVWRALLRIPPGRVTTYGAIAASVGSPGASRAVGRAVGANPIACLIPCHRVLRGTTALGGYRWGTERKRALLAWERAVCA